MNNSFLPSVQKLFAYYKQHADAASAQLSEKEIFWQPNSASNSVAIIMQHMAGNMLSRFTEFLTSDGEKTWRNRDAEFINQFSDKGLLFEYWEKGWTCLVQTLENLSDLDLEKTVYIRNEGHTVTEAIQRQLAHYASHVGQIIYIAKLLRDEQWKGLSIARNASDQFNKTKFQQEKGRRHFTDNS